MIVFTVRHTKNPYEIGIAFLEEKSAQDYVEALNAHRELYVPGSKIKYYVQELEVLEG